LGSFVAISLLIGFAHFCYTNITDNTEKYEYGLIGDETETAIPVDDAEYFPVN
jgi:hypothetical protein